MIVEIDRYLRRTGMTGSHLFKLAMGTGATYDKVRRGCELREATKARVREFMAAHPDGVAKRPTGGAGVKAKREAARQPGAA